VVPPTGTFSAGGGDRPGRTLRQQTALELTPQLGVLGDQRADMGNVELDRPDVVDDLAPKR
jgi:hypothetical protein